MRKLREPDDWSTYIGVGAVLRDLRVARGLTQAQVARGVCLERASLANVEAGRQAIPVHKLYDYARVFGVTAHELLAEIEAGLGCQVEA